MTKNSIALLMLTSLGCSALPPSNLHIKSSDSPPSKICVIGDAGIGKPGQFLVAKALAKENCEMVFYLGDIIYPSGIKDKDDYQVQEKFFKPYSSFFKKPKSIPFLLVSGNHDYMGDPSAWIEVAKKHKDKLIFPHLYFTYKWKNFCLTVVDTNPYDSFWSWLYKSYMEKQEKWLIGVNKKMKSGCSVKMALGHHPYLSSGSHGNARKKLLSFFKTYIVGQYDFYLSGHDHNLAYEGHDQKTELFVSGAGGKLRGLKKYYDGKEKFNISQLGYIVIDISQTKTKSYQLHFTFKGVEADGSTKTLYRKFFKK